MAASPRSFDPDSATAAYLQAHAVECRSLDCTPDYGPWVSLALPAITLLALGLFAGSRLAAGVRDAAERLTMRRWLQDGVFAVALVLFVGLAQMPVHYWLQHVVKAGSRLTVRVRDLRGNWIETSGGTPSPAEWAVDHISTLIWFAILGAIALPLVLLAIRQMPRRYWTIAALAGSAWLIWALADSPYERFTPLPRGPLLADIEAMARGSGQSPDQLRLGEQSLFEGGFLDAEVRWSSAGPHVVISERLFNVLGVPPENFRPPYRPVTAAEVRATAGHELAHLKLKHLYILPLLWLGLIWLLVWLAAATALRLIGILGRSWRLRDAGDTAAFPVVALTFGLAFCAFFPLGNAIQQVAEAHADAVGLDIARDPDGFAAVAMRSARGGPIRRPPIEQWLFDDHPSPEARIRRAMAWKAGNAPAKWRATGLSGPIRVRR